MTPYEPYLNEADCYFKIVSNSVKNKKKLGNKVLFSMSTMIIEKYFVALLTAKDIPVSGHSMLTLIELGRKHFSNLPKSVSALEEIDDKIDLCSFNAVSMEEITDQDIDLLYAKLVTLKTFVHEQTSNTTATV